jgi:UDPglucose--hexose-1-phosphate uridylyltransferase
VRIVEWDDQFVAFCPFASRVPYETWILPVHHHHAFGKDVTDWDRQLRLARILKSVIRRLGQVAPAYHLVLHTSPNVNAKFEKTGLWRSLTGEILPVVQTESKSYSIKEVYYNSLLPEVAAEELRKVEAETEVKR